MRLWEERPETGTTYTGLIPAAIVGAGIAVWLGVGIALIVVFIVGLFDLLGWR